MTDADRRQLTREGILGDLAAARPASLPADTLLLGRRQAGLPLTATELENELTYLESKDMVRPVRSALSAGAKRHAITAAGIDHLEAEGLA